MKFKISLFFTLMIVAFLFYIDRSEEFEKAPEKLYINGQIFSLEKGEISSQAMLIKEGKIVSIGSNEYLLADKSPETEVIDLNNQVVLPGFIDSHSHVALSTFFSEMVDLSGFTHKNNQQVWAHLKQAIKNKKPGQLIIGKGIDSALVKDLHLPTKDFLDQISPNNPIILISQSMHTYWANSEVFAALGITRDTEVESESSFYGKDEEGSLNGMIIEQKAFVPFLSYMKKQALTPEIMVKSTVETFRDYAAKGNTTVVSLGLSIDEKKPLRLYEHISSDQTSFFNKLLSFANILPEREAIPRHFIFIRHDKVFLLPQEKLSNDFYNIIGVKHWYDGSPYTGSMYLQDPYKKSKFSQQDLQLPEHHKGEGLIDDKELERFISLYHKAGWQIAIHAQGDQANEDVIQAFKNTGLDFSESRHRVEHCVLLSKSSMQKLVEVNLFPNFHINHLLYYGDILSDELLGEQRAEKILALKSAKEAGLKFALHADQPMFESKPFRLIQTAVERKTTSGKVLGSDQRISVLDAIRAMTIDAAYSIEMEAKLGTLAKGKYADFIIIDKNPFEIPVAELEQIKIVQTFVNGNEVDIHR